MVLVDLERVAARRPDRPLFEDLSLTVCSGDRLGVVGRNGSGKSTLLGVLAGQTTPEEGVARRGRHIRTGFLGQRPVLPAGSVREAVGPHWEASAILERLGMGPWADADVSQLSGGQAKRVALARALVDEVDLLVLDEPTNHLDLDAVAWLEARLAGLRAGVVLVSHDRHVLDRVTTRILELDRGRGHLHDGYQAYLGAHAERAEREAATEAGRRNLARAELAWLRRGAPARSRKPKARLAAATAVVEGAGPGPDRPQPLALVAAGRGAGTPRLGNKVVTLSGAGHRFGTGPWLFRDLDLDLAPRGRLGVVGPNGSGKSTLLDILAGRRLPSAGGVERGVTVRVGYYDQVGADLDPAQRVREAVVNQGRSPSPASSPPTWEQTRLMERFWFDADAQWAPIGTLSGGERRRLQLLLVLAELPNVLLLDEPTNDLDLDTLRALEDYLEGWPGSLVVVSHDRALLERTVEDVLVVDGQGVDGQGGAALAPGGYAGYRAARSPAGGSTGRAVGEPAPARGVARAGAGQATAVTRGRGQAAPPERRDDDGKARSPSTLRRLMALAEREMTEAARERDRLAGHMASVVADHVELARTGHELAEAEVRLSRAEERWLALAEELGA